MNWSVADFNLDYSFHLWTEQRPCAPSPLSFLENTLVSLNSLSLCNEANLFRLEWLRLLHLIALERMNALTSSVKDTGHIYRGGVTNLDPSM